MLPAPEDKHWFRRKGWNAESFLRGLAERTFFTDWCFPNPRLPDGKELCDLLVVFGHTAIIWQAKDLRLEDGSYKPADVQKNLRQLRGAWRQLLDLRTPVELENPRRRKELFDPSTIQETFLISALLGEGEAVFPMVEHLKAQIVHVFTRDFTRIALGELDTVADFVDYLRAKERFLSDSTAHMFIHGGEQTLLAHYLLNDRRFDRLAPYDHIALDDGAWENLQADPRFLAKKAADRISYGWDEIIGRVHEGSSAYELVARELARPNRFARRALAQDFYDAHIAAHEDLTHQLYRRVSISKVPSSDTATTYCYLFMDDELPREDRRKMLMAQCLVARQRYPQNHCVLGIATEKRFASTCSYDFVFIDIPALTTEHEAQANLYRDKLGILVDPIMTETVRHEYPQAEHGT